MWGRIDDGWWSHPKTSRCSMAARGLWATALSYTSDKLTDGFIPRSVLPMLVGGDAVDVQGLIDQLVGSGLWEITDGGWIFHGFHDMNPSSDEVMEMRKRRTEAGRKGGLASQAQAHAQASARPSAQAHAQASARPSAQAKIDDCPTVGRAKIDDCSTPSPSPSPSPSLPAPSDPSDPQSQSAPVEPPPPAPVKEPGERKPTKPAEKKSRLIDMAADPKDLDAPDRIRRGFYDLWSKAHEGRPAPQEPEKDRQQAAKILSTHRNMRIAIEWPKFAALVVEAYLSMEDRFLVENGHPMALISTRWPAIVQALPREVFGDGSQQRAAGT